MKEKIKCGEFQLDTDFVLFVEKILNDLSSESDDEQKVNVLLDGVVEFYKADRAYVIEGDLEPVGAINAYERTAEGKPFQRDTLKDFPASAYEHWVELFLKKEPIIIEDMETIREAYPDEYKYFMDSEVHSLIMVPYNSRLSRGFVGIDNPKRYRVNPLALRVLAHIIMQVMMEIKLTAQNSALESVSEQEGDLVKVSLFGKLEITAKGGKLTSKEIPGKGKTILALMLLNPEIRFSTQELYDLLTTEENTTERMGVMVSNYIYKIRSSLSVIGLNKLICNEDGMYYLNPEFRIESDVLHFKELCSKMKATSDEDKKLALALELLELYTSLIPASYCDSVRFETEAMDLHMKFLDISKWCANYYLRRGMHGEAYEILYQARKIDHEDGPIILLTAKVMKSSNASGLKNFGKKMRKYLTQEECDELEEIFK